MPDKADLSVEEALITTKLTKIRQYLRYLREQQKATLDEFREDFRVLQLFLNSSFLYMPFIGILVLLR